MQATIFVVSELCKPAYKAPKSLMPVGSVRWRATCLRGYHKVDKSACFRRMCELTPYEYDQVAPMVVRLSVDSDQSMTEHF